MANHPFLFFFSGSNLSHPPLIRHKLAQWNGATVPPSGGKAQMQRLRRPGQRLPSCRGRKCNTHLIKLLINTLVFRAQWRKGGVTACNLCLAILKPKAGVKPFLLSCVEQVSFCSLCRRCFGVPFIIQVKTSLPTIHTLIKQCKFDLKLLYTLLTGANLTLAHGECVEVKSQVRQGL